MASTYTTNLGLEKVATGEQANIWGETVRTNLELIEDAISGLTTISTTGGDTTLSDTDGAADQSRAAALLVTGTLTSAANIIVPAVDKLYDITNSTSGSYAVNIKTSSGSAKEITQGYSQRVRVDSSGAVTFITPAASSSGYVEVLDEDDFTSDSAAQPPSQQSVGAYVGTYVSSRLPATKNYVVNPGPRISQENGTSSGTVSGYFPVDQWTVEHSQDGTLTSVQGVAVTPGGSTHRLRVTVTSADASLAAGQYARIVQTIEGKRVADLRFGSASAKQVVLRFGWKSPAGTYAATIRNQDTNRSYVREFTIAGGDANTDTVQTVAFPGDTSGTWDTDNTASFLVTFTLAAGSTFQTTADAWQAGNYFGTSSTTNGIGTGSSVFELFDVGLYADPDSTGTAPPFVLPHPDDDLRACQRYYHADTDGWLFDGYVSAAASTYHTVFHPVEMRTDTPTISLPNVDTLTNTANITVSGAGTYSNRFKTLLQATASADGEVAGAFDIKLNARM